MAHRTRVDINQNSEQEIAGFSNGEIGAEKYSIWDESETKKKKTQHFSRFIPFPGFGIACALFSAFFFSANALAVKLIRDVHPFQMGLSRAAVQFMILLPLMQYKRKTVDILGPEGLRGFLWLRGFAGSTAMIFLYLAINILSVGNAITITYISMILVPFIARIFLKEALTIFDVIFAMVSLSGVVLIAQPTFLFPVPEGENPPTNEIGVFWGIACATLQATSMVTIRKLGMETYPPLSVLYYSICGTFTTSLLTASIQEFKFPCRADLPFVFMLGVFGLLGQFFLTVALQYERAGTVGVLRSAQIILVYVLQVLVLGDIPTMLSLVGAALVFSSSIGIGVRKIVNEGRRRKSIAKKNSMSKIENSDLTSQTGA